MLFSAVKIETAGVPAQQLVRDAGDEAGRITGRTGCAQLLAQSLKGGAARFRALVGGHLALQLLVGLVERTRARLQFLVHSGDLSGALV